MKTISIALFGLLLVVAVSADHKAWISYKHQYNKNYKSDAEEQAHKDNFIKNLKKITDHNKLYDNGSVTYTMGLNAFSDKSPEQFKNEMRRHRRGNNSIDHTPTMAKPVGDGPIPKSIDWRTKGAVTPVKQQGQCNVCWAFGAAGALEAANFIKTGKLVELSEQNLVDCVHPEQKQCYGGWAYDAFNYIKRNGGIEKFQSYPFTQKKGQCHYNKANLGATVNSYVQLPKGDEGALTRAIAKQPCTVDINDEKIQHYSGGVFHDPSCSRQLNHILLAVGYGTDPKDGDFYILKNSWGLSINCFKFLT